MAVDSTHATSHCCTGREQRMHYQKMLASVGGSLRRSSALITIPNVPCPRQPAAYIDAPQMAYSYTTVEPVRLVACICVDDFMATQARMQLWYMVAGCEGPFIECLLWT